MRTSLDPKNETEAVPVGRGERWAARGAAALLIGVGGVVAFNALEATERDIAMTLGLVALGAFALALFGLYRYERVGTVTRPTARAAEAQAAKEKRVFFDRQLEFEQMVGRVFNLWFIRYPAAVALVVAVWWYVYSGTLGDDEWGIIILCAAAIGFALWWTREVSKWLIGIGLVVWVGSCINDGVEKMSQSEAIIFGALIIAYAIYASRQGK